MAEKIWTSDIHEDINKVYGWSQGSMEDVRLVQSFHKDQEAQLILTNTSFQKARKNVAKIAHRIRGKHVLEIGAGVGFAAIEMAKIAASVVAVESDPMWNWVFARHLYRDKPENLTWIFDRLSNTGGILEFQHFDVAVIFTRSGMKQMEQLCLKHAAEVIMFHQESEREED